MKIKALLTAVVLLLPLYALGQSSLPNKIIPKIVPKNEKIRFFESAAVLTTAAGFQIYAEHDGARQCQAEDNRAGEGKLFGTADGYGRSPYNADKRVYIVDGAILGTAVFFEYFTKHKKFAKELLIVSGSVQYGVASATYWAGCN